MWLSRFTTRSRVTCSAGVASLAIGWTLAGCSGPGQPVAVQRPAHPSASSRSASTTTAGTPTSDTAVHDQTSAQTLAQALVDQISLPPGSRAVATAPTPELDQPPQETGTPNLADAARFAVVPLDAAAVLAYARTHPPNGYTAENSGSGSTSGPHQPTEDYLMENVSDMPSGVDSATVLASVVEGSPDSTHTYIRLDAQVTWLPPKPAGLTVPADDTVAVVSVTETQPPQPQMNLPAPHQVTITDPAQFDQLRSAANGLQPGLPGPRSCPADVGTRYHVEFKLTTDSPPDITFTAGSCGDVSVTRGDRSSGDLADDAAFSNAYLGALGLPTP